MLELIRDTVTTILESQFAVPQFLNVAHWWIGAVLVVLVSGIGALLFAISFFDSDLGCSGMTVGLVLFFLGGPILGILGIYLVALALIGFLIWMWNGKWRFIGWRKF